MERLHEFAPDKAPIRMSETASLIEEPTPPACTSETLRALLRRKFPQDQFAMLHEVRDAAGFGASRSIDVLMVGLWPSRGCQIEGMELKVSRSDWLRELKKPAKAEAFVPYCDRWWIVASNKDIVRESELPPTWGLMIQRGQGIGIVKPAPQLKPEPVDRSLLAAILKRATNTLLDSPEVVALIDSKVKAAKDLFRSDKQYELHRAQNALDQLQKKLKAFEDASGISVDAPWSGERIGQAVKAVISGDHIFRMQQLAEMKRQARGLVEWLDTNIPDRVDDDAA